MNLDEIYEVIQQNLIIKNYEKNKYAEVFTPPGLINKMLDTLHKNIWENPHLKWLEPTSGIGNYMFLVYFRLMEALSIWQPDKQKRSEHIIQNMLFMVEINDKNTEISKNIFGPHCNIVCTNFLDEDKWKNEFCLKLKSKNISFDIILGNPPFQDEIVTKNKHSGGKNKLYEKIIQVSLKYLNENGYLLFISPDNLFSGNSNAIYKKVITNKNNYFVEFVSFNKDIISYFPSIQQYMCYFLLKKQTNKSTGDGSGTILSKIENNEADILSIALKNRCVNPVRHWTIENEEFVDKYISNKENSAVYNRGLTISNYEKESCKEDMYTLIYTPTKKLYTDKIECAKGIGTKKIVMFIISPNLEFECDFDGKYGCGPNTLYIPINNEAQGKILETFFKSDIYKKLAHLVMTNRNFLKISFFKYLNLDVITTNKYK